ncbi:hypothetical protein ACMHYB_25765 [Sorangium sp. So ce1128]
MTKPPGTALSGSSIDLRVLVDTSSWMHPLAEDLLTRSFVPLLNQTGQKFIVPIQVVEELRRHTGARDPALQRKACGAEDVVARFRAMGLVDIFGGSEDTFADNVFQLVMVRFCEKYRFCLITQDRDLAADALRLEQRRSINRAKEILAFRIGDQGSLDRWVLHSRQGAVWKTLEAAPTPPSAVSSPQQTSENTSTSAKFRLCTGAPRLDERRMSVAMLPGVGHAVRDGSGRQTRLTCLLGSGGEGSVFGTDSGLACKVYEGSRVTHGAQKKLELMLSKPVMHPSICWPSSLATNERGEFIGYLMPAARGKQLQRAVFVKPLLESNFPRWTRYQLVALALAILEPLIELHSRNVLLGDINPLNILVVDQKTVFFVDTDSYQIEDFPCPVGTATFLTPDLLGKNLAAVLREYSHEFFAVATLMFMTLMPGKPPYSHAGGGDPAENVRRRHFPYSLAEKKGKGVPDGPWRFMWSHLPFYLKEAFHGVFSEGELLRTDEWAELMRRYQQDIVKGYVSDVIFPTTFKRLRQEDVLRRGGAWHCCAECGEGYGVFDNSSSGDLCPDCRNAEVPCKCFLCDQDFVMRQAQVRQLANRPRICQPCRALKQIETCRSCGQQFELAATDRAYFKRKNLSLPKRCRGCRQRSRSTVSSPQAAAAGNPGASVELGDDRGFWDSLRDLFKL